MTDKLLDLALLFGHLSLLMFGGGPSILPELQRQVTEVHGWVTPQQFAALFALAQASPGPNMLVVALIGWRVAGFAGAVVAFGSLCAPSSLLTYVTAGLWYRFRHSAWRRTVQAGLVPVTAGLIMGGALVLAGTTTLGWRTGLLTAVATIALTATRIHPMVVLTAGALLGATGLLE
ncbi:MAG: chromate transporter [Acetobacteraceae bacterium]